MEMLRERITLSRRERSGMVPQAVSSSPKMWTGILALLDGGAGIYQMPQPAGDPFRPKRSIRRENFVIVGIALDVCCVHRIQRITQTGYIVKNAPYSAGNQFSIQKSCASCFLEILGLSILGYGAKTGYVGTVDFGNLCRRIDHDDAAATALVAP